jgi:predicted RNA-binding protein with PIN domain
MANIIIDGYNVIGIFHKDMEKARMDFVNLLIDYKKIRNHNITVVFDGYKNGALTEKISVIGDVRVIFTRLGISADDFIKKTISKDKRQWIVVSDDRDIVSYAWSENSIPIPSEMFYEIASRQVKNSLDSKTDNIDSTDLYEDEDFKQKNIKGNPFRLSKKSKTIRKALNKL